mmetsp:Transcript_40498/g.116949  ORF Transcript_40498/g.116949 Transcript_40498/m.116949 type:complete len:213 (-) Transcript_40498:9-647(-)
MNAPLRMPTRTMRSPLHQFSMRRATMRTPASISSRVRTSRRFFWSWKYFEPANGGCMFLSRSGARKACLLAAAASKIARCSVSSAASRARTSRKTPLTSGGTGRPAMSSGSRRLTSSRLVMLTEGLAKAVSHSGSSASLSGSAAESSALSDDCSPIHAQEGTARSRFRGGSLSVGGDAPGSDSIDALGRRSSGICVATRGEAARGMGGLLPN